MNLPWYLLLALGFLIAGSWWFARGWRKKPRTCLLCVCCAILLVLPWFVSPVQFRARFGVLLACCAVLMPKLVDASCTPKVWQRRTLRQWLGYLINPFVLCYRRHLTDKPRPLRKNLRYTFRGVVEVAVGVAVLCWSFQRDWVHTSFWLEHTAKLVGIYLAAFDGAFVLANGLLGLFGGAYLDFSRNPAFARTPADFWRRYNRDAGRFLNENVFIPLGRRHPLRGIAAVFLFNGLLHEYLAFVLSGRLAGFQVAFFSVQGLAVALTWRWRPGGWSAIGSAGLTIAFNIVTLSLFFASVNLLLPWYSDRAGH